MRGVRGSVLFLQNSSLSSLLTPKISNVGTCYESEMSFLFELAELNRTNVGCATFGRIYPMFESPCTTPICAKKQSNKAVIFSGAKPGTGAFFFTAFFIVLTIILTQNDKSVYGCYDSDLNFYFIR